MAGRDFRACGALARCRAGLRRAAVQAPSRPVRNRALRFIAWASLPLTWGRRWRTASPVFKLPHAINALAQWHPRWVYQSLMLCTAAMNWRGAPVTRHRRGSSVSTRSSATAEWSMPRCRWQGPAAVLDCLSRYNLREAVSNERSLSMDVAGVRLRACADKQGGKRVITLDGPGFMGRSLQHALPSGFKRIRPLLPTQPSAQNRAHGHRACRAEPAGRKRPGPRGRRQVPQARGADRRHRRYERCKTLQSRSARRCGGAPRRISP